MVPGMLFAQRRGGGFIGDMIRFFIQIIIYQICLEFIMQIFGVSRFVAMFIFLAILLVIIFGGYMMRQRWATGADD